MNWSHIKQSMKKEVSLTRELLSNLIAEENSLLWQDKTTWNDIMHKRFDLTQSLKSFRKERKDLTCHLNEENQCELSLLLDQLIPLIDKVNEQSVRNKYLMEKGEHVIAIRKQLEYPVPMEAKVPVRKNRLTTI